MKTTKRSKDYAEDEEDGRGGGSGGGGSDKEDEGTTDMDDDAGVADDDDALVEAPADVPVTFRRLVRAGPLLASSHNFFRSGGDGKSSAAPSASSLRPPPPSSQHHNNNNNKKKKKMDRTLDVLEAWTVLKPIVSRDYIVLPQQSHEMEGGNRRSFALEVVSGRTSRTVATLIPPLITTTKERLDKEEGNDEEGKEEEVEDGGDKEDDIEEAGSEEDIGAGYMVSAAAVDSSLLYVGLSTGAVCEYNLDDCDDNGGGEAVGDSLPNVPPRRSFRLRWTQELPAPNDPTIPPKDDDDVAEAMEVEVETEQLQDESRSDGKEIQEEKEDPEVQEEAEPKDVGMAPPSSRRKRKYEAQVAAAVAAAAAADKAAAAVAAAAAADKTSAQVDEDEWALNKLTVASKPMPLRLHHVTFVSERSANNNNDDDEDDAGTTLVGYGLASPIGDGDEDSAPAAASAKRKSGPRPRPTMMLARFRVPPHSSSPSPSDVTTLHVRVLDRWEPDDTGTIRGTFKPRSYVPTKYPAGARIPFRLLATHVPSATRPNKSTNVVLVASPSGLAIYGDDNNEDPNDDKVEAEAGTKGDVRQDVATGASAVPARKPGRLPVAVIQHPRKASNLLTAVAMSASSGVVATAHWSGEIYVWPTLVQDVVQYLADRERLLKEQAESLSGRKKKAKKKKDGTGGGGVSHLLPHPVKTSQSIRLHWHAHPVSSILFSPDDPAVLYSGGEESVLCVWEWKRSEAVSRVLPRISTGPIVHVAAASGSSSSSAGEGGSRGIIVHTSDNVLHCVLPHSLAVAWKKSGLAAEPTHSRKLVDSSSSSDVSSAPATLRPIMLTDRHTQSLLLTGLPRSPAAMQEWNCARGEGHLDKSWIVAPHNRVSRQDWDDDDVAGPFVKCASYAPPGTLLTVDVFPTENQSIGLNGLVTTLKFWTRRRERWALSCAMSSPHGSLNDVSAIAVAPNGAAAVSISNTEKAWRLWRKRTSKQSKQDETSDTSASEWMGAYRVEMPMGLSNYAVGRDAVAFSADSSVLAMAHGFLISLWDYASMSLLITLRHTSQDRFLTLQPTNELPLAVHTLQFASHADMILTASEESVALQSPDGGERGRLVKSDGWSHKAPSGFRITGATEVVRNRTHKLVAVVSYSLVRDESVVELLDLVSGQLLWTVPGWSGKIVSMAAYPSRQQGQHDDGRRHSQPSSSSGGGGSVWDMVPSYTPVKLTIAELSHGAAAVAAAAAREAASSLPPPFRIPPEPLELLLLNSRGQLLSLFEEVDGGGKAAADDPPPGARSRDVDDTPMLPKIAMFDATSANKKHQQREQSTVDVMDWKELASAMEPSSSGDGGAPMDLDGDAATSSSLDVTVPTTRLGSAFVRAFVSRRTGAS